MVGGLRAFFLATALLSGSLEMVTAHETFTNMPNETDSTVEELMQKIHLLDALYDTTNETEILELYNELGIRYFFTENYTSALECFDHILRKNSALDGQQVILWGAALCGRMICHACLDGMEEFAQDLLVLEHYFDHLVQCQPPCNAYEIPTSSALTFQKVAQPPVPERIPSRHIQRAHVTFADPNEQVSVRECKNRVEGSADALRTLISPLVRDPAKRTLFLSFIGAIERKGLSCCEYGGVWTACVSPLLEKLHKWKMFGIPAAPEWD